MASLVEVDVVGGGIAGLAALVALQRMAGFETLRLWESSTEEDFYDEQQGSALQLGPNGLKALRAMDQDLYQRVLQEGSHLQGNHVFLPNNQTMMIPDTTKQDTGLPQILIRWGVLRRLLQASLDTTKCHIKTGTTITDYTIHKDGKVTLHSNEKELDHSASMVVVADGIYSKIGAKLRGYDDAMQNIKHNGRVNIKAAAPKELPDHADGTTKSFFTPTGDVACFAGPAGPGHTYWAISIADDGHRFDLRYDDDAEARKEALLERLAGSQAPGFATELVSCTDAHRVFCRPSEETTNVGEWLARDGVVLMGDAAHAMSPAYGQSANFSLEDAATLGAAMGDNDRYSLARVRRCAKMIEMSFARRTKGQTDTNDIWNWIFEWEPPTFQPTNNP